MPEAMDEWSLLVGRTIEIRRDGKYVRTAEVEAATSDSSIMWGSPHVFRGFLYRR
jgi:hypothetical protein